MAGFMYPLSEQIAIVTAIKLPFATGLLKLFKQAITFNAQLTAADFAAIECDFSGYVAKTLTTLPAPWIDPLRGGVSFDIPTQQWNCADPTTIPNQVFGGWVEDAGGALLVAWQITNPWVMDAPSKSLPLDLLFNWFGTDQVYVSIAGAPQ